MRASLVGVVLLCSSAVPLRGQASADQAQLVLTVAAGYRGGSSLWQVNGQSISSTDPFFPGTDVVTLNRDVRTSIGVLFAGTYFPGDHIGITGEALLLGLGTEDGCKLTHSVGDATNRDLCTAIDHTSRGGTAVALSGGLIYRLVTRSGFSPYIRANLGATITQQSVIKTSGEVNTPDGPADDVILDDRSARRLHPYVAAGIGFSVVVGQGYQLRLEARDNYLTLPIPLGPTTEGSVPRTGTKSLHLFSLMLGFDVVLEKRRGRRY